MDDLTESEIHEIEPEKLGGPTVDEIHVDFLLEEEFRVDPSFLQSFIAAAVKSMDLTNVPDFMKESCQHGAELSLKSVRHSVSDLHGEADLIVIYELGGRRERVAILVEDKIHAHFQPRQAQRYQDRGALGKNQGEWERYFTCLVASRSYIRAGHGFDAVIELEEIRKWFVSIDPKRAEFKSEVIDMAIQKASMVGVKVVDATMTDFRKRHYALFEEFFCGDLQDFKLRHPAPTWKGDSWFEIRNRLLPRGVYINQKADRGFVDLTFPDTNASRLKDIKPILETGMQIEQTSKSVAIRVTVPSVKDFSSFEEERDNVVEGFKAVRRLLDFYIRERDRLEPILADGRTMAH